MNELPTGYREEALALNDTGILEKCTMNFLQMHAASIIIHNYIQQQRVYSLYHSKRPH